MPVMQESLFERFYMMIKETAFTFPGKISSPDLSVILSEPKSTDFSRNTPNNRHNIQLFKILLYMPRIAHNMLFTYNEGANRFILICFVQPQLSVLRSKKYRSRQTRLL